MYCRLQGYPSPPLVSHRIARRPCQGGRHLDSLGSGTEDRLGGSGGGVLCSHTDEIPTDGSSTERHHYSLWFDGASD